MTVVIHALGASMGGAVRHLTGFLSELPRADRSEDYIVLVRESFPAVATGANVRLERFPDAEAARTSARIVADHVSLPLRIRRQKVSAVVSLFNFGPIWSPAPHILYQSNALFYDAHYLDSLRGRLRITTALRRRLALESMKRADLIVTPSDAMTEMIRAQWPDALDHRFHTLYRGFSKATMQEPLSPDQGRILALAKGWKLLYPTHLAAHKGFDVLLDILAELKALGLRFELVTTIAREDWPAGMQQCERRIGRLELSDRIAFVGRTAQNQMGTLYAYCDLMVYPSFCESFGLPLIEAMGYGLPIVAAGTAVNRELCQEAALYYPSFDASAGARAIQDALDPRTLQRLRAAGAARMASFDWSWARYAREFVQLVRSVQ